MKNLKVSTNQQGMSLIEVIMGCLVLGIFVVGLSGLLNFAADQNQKILVKTEEGLDALIGERIVFSDFKYIMPSFNNMWVYDNAGRLFFDYFPDLPETLLTNRLPRRLTISATSPRTLTFMTLDLTEAPPMIYDPTSAFTCSESSRDLRTRGVCQFQSVNREDYVNRMQNSFIQRSGVNFWRDGKVMMLDTPARIRPLNASGGVDLLIPPRSPVFVGRVSGNQLLKLPVPEINDFHPREPRPRIPDAAMLLGRIPEIGGTAPVVRLSHVKIVRYSGVPARQGAGRIDLVRQVYEGAAFSQPQTVASNISRAEFARDSVLQPIVSFQIIYNEVSP